MMLRRTTVLFYLGLLPILILLGCWADSMRNTTVWSLNRGATMPVSHGEVCLDNYLQLGLANGSLSLDQVKWNSPNPCGPEKGLWRYTWGNKPPWFPTFQYDQRHDPDEESTRVKIPFWQILALYVPFWLGLSWWDRQRVRARMASLEFALAAEDAGAPLPP